MKNSVKKKINYKWLINLFFIFILAIVSMFTYSKYQNINEVIKKDTRNVFEDGRVLEAFNKFKIYYASELLKDVEGYKDGIIQGLDNNNYDFNEEEDMILAEKERISNIKNFIDSNYSNMHVFVSRIDDEEKKLVICQG